MKYNIKDKLKNLTFKKIAIYFGLIIFMIIIFWGDRLIGHGMNIVRMIFSIFD